MNNSILIYFILIFFILIKKKSKKSKIENFTSTTNNDDSNNTLKIYPSSNFEQVKTDYKLIFYISDTIPSGGKIEIEFPSGYDLTDTKIKKTSGNNPRPLITGTNGSAGTFDESINGNKILLTRKSDGEDWEYVSYCYDICSDPKPNKSGRSISGNVVVDSQGNKTCNIKDQTTQEDKSLNQNDCDSSIETIYKKINMVTINLTGIKNPVKGKTSAFKIISKKSDGSEIESFVSLGVDIIDNSCPTGYKYNYTFCKTYNYQCHKKGASDDDICVNSKGETAAQSAVKYNLTKSLPGMGNLTMASMPFGTILPFMGDDIPYGWFECNGENNTPDLRGKFLYGINQNNFNAYKREVEVDLSGNYIHKSDYITLKEDNLPKHVHGGAVDSDDTIIHGGTYNDDGTVKKDSSGNYVKDLTQKTDSAGHSHKLYKTTDKNAVAGIFTWDDWFLNPSESLKTTNVGNDGLHSHDFTTIKTIETKSGSDIEAESKSFEIMPPYYVVRYIIRLI